MLRSLRRRIIATCSMSIAFTVMSPAIAHAAWTPATPNHPKLTGNPALSHAGVVELVPLSAVPPAPSIPHLTGSFLSTGGSIDNGSVIQIGIGTFTSGIPVIADPGTLNLNGGFTGSGTLNLNDLNDILNRLGTVNSSGNLSVTTVDGGTPITGITEPVSGADGSGILITDPATSPIDTSPILDGALTITSGAGSLNAGTLSFYLLPSTTPKTIDITDTPKTFDITDLETFLSQLDLTSSGNLSTIELTELNIILNGLDTTLSDGTAQSSTPSLQLLTAAAPAPEPASLTLLALAAPLLLKRRRA